MADTTDLVFKKIVGRQYTTSAKSWYEEQPGVPFKLHGEDVWIGDIPSTPPSSGTLDIHIYNTLTLTQDITVANQKSWLAEDPVGIRIGSFITPRYGHGYFVRLYDANDGEIPTTDPSGWFFDYELGVLSFDNDPGSYGWNDSAFKVKAYRYIGPTALDIAPASGTLSASEINNDSSVPGLSVSDALDYLINNTQTGSFLFNQPLIVVSGTLVYSLPDMPASGTVQVFMNGLIQEPNVDYYVYGKVVTFASPNEVDDVILSHYIKESV